MDIKVVELGDVPLIINTLQKSNLFFSTENFTNFISNPQTAAFIKQTPERVVGFAYGYFLVRPNGKRMFHLQTIDISPAWQKGAFDSSLLEFVLDYVQNNDCSECFVIADKGQSHLCQLYEKYGGKSDPDHEIVYVFDFNK